MWSFALFAIALVAVTLLALLRPLLSGKPPRGDEPARDANLDIHRERLRELESEQRAGRVTAEEGIAAREEIERELLGDVDSSESKPGDRSPAWRTALVIALALPVLGFAVYFHLGAWHSLVEAPAEGVPDPGVEPALFRIGRPHLGADQRVRHEEHDTQ